jgi:CheY-like chemotaxis protein
MGLSDLDGLRVLLVEDEALIAMLIGDALSDLGCTVVASAGNLADALDKAASVECDLAVLDVNLNGSPAYPIAELLAGRRIPFIFSTGYGASGVPEAFGAAPVLAKPFNEGDMACALLAAMSGKPGSG